jgi:hypothetical protein
MADRAAYNECMRPFITGSGKTKEKRKQDFCVGAKICSGKAGTEEEAAALCARSVPKWAKQAKPKEDENLSCPDRMTRVRQTIDAITLGLKSGDVDEMLPATAQLLNDVTQCAPSQEVIDLAGVVAKDLKGLSGRFYLKGEAKNAMNQLAVLKELL